MPFDEMRRRQQAIARRRRKKKFSLLLSQITVPSPHYDNDFDRNGGGGSKLKYAILSVAPVMLVLWLFFGSTSHEQETLLSQTVDRNAVRHKYWRANVIEHKGDDEAEEDGEVPLFEKLGKQSKRPFDYIGDFDPALPKPWPEEEKRWHQLHKTLVGRVRESDEAKPLPFDMEKMRLPQLVFFGDSITEGWLGTSFGNVPGKHRMWEADEPNEIREVFDKTFGKGSMWGKRALKPPLVLGISGSRTYDFIWRIEDGEFPTSKLLDAEEKGGDEDEGEDDDFSQSVFQLDNLERIYVVLMGTNNLGGGMLPGPTVSGMNAAGRAILKLHKEKFPRAPAAMLFSELLPRHDDFRATKMCPPRCANNTTSTPYKSFMPAIEKVNRELPTVVEGWRNEFENSRIVLLSSRSEKASNGSGEGKEEEEEDDDLASKDATDVNTYAKTVHCGKEMFAIDDDEEFGEYMPDRLHPNAKGYELWSRCIMKGLEEIMDHSIHLSDEEEAES